MGISDKLFRALPDDRYAHDLDTPARIFREIGLLYENELDDIQVLALRVSENYRKDKDSYSAKRDAYHQVLSDRLDHYLEQGLDESRASVLNRVVWCSLVTTGGLTYEVCDFIVELATALGTSEEDLDKLFSKYVPNYCQVTE